MRMRPETLIIENHSKNLELEKRLIQYVEEEINGVLIGNNKWRCDLANTPWSLQYIRKEIAHLVKGDPGGVVLWFRQQSLFHFRERWMRVAIHSGQERATKIDTKEINKRFGVA